MVDLVELHWLLVERGLLFRPDEHGLHFDFSIFFIGLPFFEIVLFEDEGVVFNIFLLFENV